ncbi:hypothetical protein [Reyranella sp.]|uniref:bestrophin-like domain n=1 Tax=Reyranella sp. TaxID=1929291 RepID=UPI003783FCA9
MATVAFALILAGTIAGTMLRSRLPEPHLTGDSKEVIRLATALVGTLTAVVLALLFAATRTSFEHTSSYVSRLAADITELDEILRDYGPEAAPVRTQLRAEIGPLIDSIWQEQAVKAGRPTSLRTAHDASATYLLRQLQPKNSVQASLQARALAITTDIAQTRLALFAQPPDSVSHPFIIVLVLWLTFIFTTFSMSAKPNPTLTIVLGVCVLSASAAVYLILELGQPFDGLMQVSNDTLRSALRPI